VETAAAGTSKIMVDSTLFAFYCKWIHELANLFEYLLNFGITNLLLIADSALQSHISNPVQNLS